MRSRGYLAAFLLVGACSVDAPESSSTEQDALRFGAHGFHRKVRICHATGSPTRPFVPISVSPHGLKGHRHHPNDIIPAPPQGCPGDNPPPACTPGSTRACYDGPAGTEGVGTCAAGTQVCNAVGSGFGPCQGAVTPTTDVCGDGLDNDCDGTPDDACVCAPGSSATCYDGPAGTAGVGSCAAGTQICTADGSGFGPCEGSVTPTADVCGDGLDSDCDGTADDGCVCAPGATAACYGGPPGTEGVGTCAAGTQTCNADGSAYGPCVGAVLPTADVCIDGLDNDCDGTADDGCVCAPGGAAACYDGPPGTQGIGACAAGTMICNADGSAYGPCQGAVTPTAEICDGLDNDCNGLADDAPQCQTEIACNNGVDDNLNGLTDCADPDCATAPICTTEASCGNGIDDDGDGLTDCAEPGCATNAACLTPAAERFCNDGVDNDGDGLIDAAEAACGWAIAALPSCAPGKLQAYRFTGNTVLADPGLTTVNLVAGGPGTVGTIAVRVTLTHTFDADLDISLASALNTTVDLSSDNGGTADNYQNTVFVDSAAVSIVAGVPPFTGSFRPEAPLSALAGQAVAGTWRGLINDDTAGFQGSLGEYGLAICIQ